MKKFGFSLAEVLASLTIISVIGALTLPTVKQYGLEKQYYAAYKKAFLVATDAMEVALASGKYKRRDGRDDADGNTSAKDNFKLFSEYFRITKECFDNNNSSCWNHDGEKALNVRPRDEEFAFVDSSNFAWSLYENTENIILVDTNGKKGPNRYGKDRWYFVPVDKEGRRAELSEENGGPAVSLAPYFFYDMNESNENWCHYPPCKFKSGLE